MPKFERIMAVQIRLEGKLKSLPDDIGLLFGGIIAALVFLTYTGYNNTFDLLLVFLTGLTLFAVPLSLFIANTNIKREVARWQSQSQSECIE